MDFGVLRLDKFPTEVLECILTDHIGSSIIDLWKCGSKSLNYRISNGGCREVSLEDMNPMSKNRFPKMLHSLQLRKLRIHIESRRLLAGCYELRGRLLKLSSDLESLSLMCRESESCFFSHPVINDEHGVFSSSVEDKYDISSMKNVDSSMYSPLWDIGAKFPKLNSLSVCTAGVSIIAPVASYLPSTLTALSIMSRYDDAITSEWPLLPPNLTWLHVPMFPNLTEFSRLPPHLKILKQSGPHFVTSSNVATLPKRLQMGNFHFEWSQEVAENFPLELTTATISMKNRSAPLSFLPKHLTSIDFRNCTLDAQQLRSLPHSVTDMRVNDLSWYYIGDQTCFPPNLESFSTQSEYLISTHMEKLPRTLKKLSVIFSGKDMENCFRYLPPALETLDFGVGSRLHAPLVMALPFFPSNLKNFTCTFRLNFTVPKTSEQLVFYPLNDRIPSCLTEFDVKSSVPPLEALPASLTKLGAGLMNPASFAHLPPQLLNLSCELSATPSKEHFNNIPRRLRMLEIRDMVETTQLEEDSFAALPASIVELKFNSNWGNIKKTPYRLLHYLPSKLEELHINVDSLENESFLKLPKTLVSLFISSWSFDNTTVDILRDLPPKLVTVGFLSGGFTIAKEVRRIKQFSKPVPDH